MSARWFPHILSPLPAKQQDPLSGDGFKAALSVVAKGLHDEKEQGINNLD